MDAACKAVERKGLRNVMKIKHEVKKKKITPKQDSNYNQLNGGKVDFWRRNMPKGSILMMRNERLHKNKNKKNK